MHSIIEFTIYFQRASTFKTDLTTNIFLCGKVKVQLNFKSTNKSKDYFTEIF